MSGFIVVALSSLLVQQSMPHPSSRSLYTAPAIRPFEPPPDFGASRAQGDTENGTHRRPLETPVRVDAYVRSYEATPTDVDVAYDQGVASAEVRVDQSAGAMDGIWSITDADGLLLYEVILHDAGAGPVEGGWRGGSGSGAAILEGRVLKLEGAGTMTLEPAGSGWRGELTRDRRTRPASLTRPR